MFNIINLSYYFIGLFYCLSVLFVIYLGLKVNLIKAIFVKLDFYYIKTFYFSFLVVYWLID